jgi:hypothetical protein
MSGHVAILAKKRVNQEGAGWSGDDSHSQAGSSKAVKTDRPRFAIEGPEFVAHLG